MPRPAAIAIRFGLLSTGSAAEIAVIQEGLSIPPQQTRLREFGNLLRARRPVSFPRERGQGSSPLMATQLPRVFLS